MADNGVTSNKLAAGLIRAMTFLYDFSVLTGAAGALTMTATDGTAQKLPAGALVVGSITQTATALTSGGSATVALGLTSQTAILKAATAYNAAPFTTAGLCYTALVASGASTKISVETSVLATVATADLTAGKFYTTVWFIPSQF